MAKLQAKCDNTVQQAANKQEFRNIKELETLREITTKLTAHNEARIGANSDAETDKSDLSNKIIALTARYELSTWYSRAICSQDPREEMRFAAMLRARILRQWRL
jgi:hypothetical protein